MELKKERIIDREVVLEMLRGIHQAKLAEALEDADFYLAELNEEEVIIISGSDSPLLVNMGACSWYGMFDPRNCGAWLF